MAKKKSANKGKIASSVTPQGYAQDAEFAQEPKSEIENNAKKGNTKR